MVMKGNVRDPCVDENVLYVAHVLMAIPGGIIAV